MGGNADCSPDEVLSGCMAYSQVKWTFTNLCKDITNIRCCHMTRVLWQHHKPESIPVSASLVGWILKLEIFVKRAMLYLFIPFSFPHKLNSILSLSFHQHSRNYQWALFWQDQHKSYKSIHLPTTIPWGSQMNLTFSSSSLI